jgi:hypothetical protein
MYPPFNLAKMYSDIAVLSSNTINFKEGDIVHGQGFNWTDLYKTRNVSFLDKEFTIPPPIDSIYYLIISTCIYLILTWYFDNVLAGQHGSPKTPYFFLTRGILLLFHLI